jgi:predicted PurR-regulated permease PerM
MLPQNKLKTYLALFILAAAGWLMHGFISALLWSFVIAIATWPLRDRVAKKLNNTVVAVIMTTGVAILLFFPILYVLINAAFDLGKLTTWVLQAQKYGISVPDQIYLIPVLGTPIAKWWAVNLTNPTGLSVFLGNAGWIKEYAQSLGSQVIQRMITLIFTIVTLFFLYEFGDSLAVKSLILLKNLTGEIGKRYALHAVAAVRATVNGVVLVGLAEGFIIGISYWLTDTPHAAILGLATGALAMIPFAAPLIFIGVAFVLLIKGELFAAISVFSFGTLVLSIGDHIVRPKIIGSSVELPFLWVFFGILGGLEVFGLIGLFIGPALMAMFLMIWSDVTKIEEEAE